MQGTWELPDRLHTSRLVLRAHRLDDVDDLLEFHSDPEVVRYLPWPVRDREQVLEHLGRRVEQTRAATDGEWVAYAAEFEGTVVGEVLLKRVSVTVAELGYAFARRVHGTGVASEACAAMLDLGSARFGIERVIAVVDPRNSASIRLLERFGFVPDESRDPAFLQFARVATP